MTERPVLRSRPAAGRPVLAALSFGTASCALAACILADKDIEFEDEAISNRNPVRLVEATMLSGEAEWSCEPNKDPDVSIAEPGNCPQPGVDPRDVYPHYLDPAFTKPDKDDPKTLTRPFLFCSCPEGKIDSNTLLYTLYVEDQDEKARSREPKDSIYAALLLDVPQGAAKPDSYVDYLRYIDPDRPLDISDIEYEPRRRRDPQLRQLVLGVRTDGDDQTGLDLCNGGRSSLSPGHHALTIMVTDRPWFRPPKGNGTRHYGVPDLAAGATFDTMTYVFYCSSPTLPDDPDECTERCVEPGPVVQ